MKNALILVIGLFSTLAFANRTGNGVGNGGDAVLCRPSSDNSFEGYYSLDYLVKFEKANLAVPAKSLNESLDRLEKLISQKLPELASDFTEFRRQVFNTTDASLKYFWEKSEFGLIDLKDEDLIGLLPKNCMTDDQIKVVQAVIRASDLSSGRPLGKFLMHYVPDVTEKLQSTNPIQLSFLIVHEWLWNFGDLPERNRRINYWLHSSRLENWSHEEWVKNLNGIGFKFPDQEVDIYNESVCPESPRELETLFARADRMERLHFLNLGYGKVGHHAKACQVSLDRCNNYFGPPMFYKGHMTFFTNPYPLVTLYNDRIELSSRIDGQRAFNHSTCPLDRKTKSIGPCSPFIVPSGHVYDPELSFRVTVGKGCIRMYEQKNIPWDDKPPMNDFMNMMEYVFLFQKVQY